MNNGLSNVMGLETKRRYDDCLVWIKVDLFPSLLHRKPIYF